MAAYHSSFGFPWILDALAKYDRGIVKQKPVPAQVIEIVKMPNPSPEENQYPEVVVHISDQKFYIRAVITRDAKETLEREDEHFTVADIKNKIIILKKFSVCFTVDEDIELCGFFLSVQHFSVVAMEITPVDLINCNMEPGVRKKICELWQKYIKESEMSETSDLNLSDVSLTQLLMVASEEKFATLKSVAEHCLELNPFNTQDLLEQAITKWNNKENTSRFSIPVNFLLIPPHEEAALEHMAEFRSNLQHCSDIDVTSVEMSPQLYSTAISTLSEEPIDDGPNNQSRNPWNKLQSLYVAACSDSQPRISPPVAELGDKEEIVADPDSCTPDIFISHIDESLSDSTKGHVSLALSEVCPTPQLPEAKILKLQQTNNSSSNSGLCKEKGLPPAILSSLRLIPLTQDSSGYQMHVSPQKVQISPTLSHGPESESCSRINSHVLPENSMNEVKYSLRTRKILKRNHAVEECDTTLSDLDEQVPVCVGKTDSVPVDSQVHNELDKQLVDRHRTGPVLKELERTEQFIKITRTERTKEQSAAKKYIRPSKPSLQFVVKPKNKGSEIKKILSTSEMLKTDRTNLNVATSHAECEQSSSVQAKKRNVASVVEPRKDKLIHYDGTPFQYKYKHPPPDLCARVNSIRMPANLCEWAVTFLSEHKQKVP